MILASLFAAALSAAPAPYVVAASYGVTCAAAPGRPNKCLPHKAARDAAPKQAAAGRIVCHPDPTKSIGCFNEKARKAAEQRAEAARQADKA
ncbi:MAG: hypothetical protein V4521_10005 [Pseudomonadota bacterium]